jgi:superfamily II DNA or RNA helicase
MAEWGADTRRTAVVLPTGSGKSTVIAKIASESARMGLRVVMLAHRAELLDQMADTVTAVNPDLRPGIVRASQNENRHQIVAASFQTLTNERRLQQIGARQVILCDETHHVSSPTYRAVVESFGPETFFCGFTATLRREDGKPLRDLIDSVAYERSLRWAIDKGHLVKPVGLTVKIPALDLDKVSTTAGDFQQDELAEVMEAETPEIVKAILKHSEGRQPIVFAASVLAAHDIAQLLTESGMPAEAVTGAMAYEDREPIYKRFRTGSTRALVTVVVLTEGADFPMCDEVVIGRPTKSSNRYSQMVGRALRTWPGKKDALVLDLVGTSRVLKLVTLTSLDAGTISKTVDTDGTELPPEDYEDVGPVDSIGTTLRRRLGPIDTIGIDLLGKAETGILWMGTHKGVPFVSPIESGQAWFLWECPQGMYKVGFMSVKGERTGTWLEDGKEMPFSVARDVAEDHIIDSGYDFPLRNASWRKTSAPSEAQIRFASSLGIADCELMTRARLSDEITIALMSRRLDPAR